MYMDVGVWVSVCFGWLVELSLASEMSKRPFFVYFDTKTTKRVVPMKNSKTRRKGQRTLVS